MVKKFFLVFVFALVLSGSVFSTAQFKHQRGDMFVGFDLGMGFTPSLFSILPATNSFAKGNYALTFDLGINYNYYQTEWLSFSAGLTGHFRIYAFLSEDLRDLGPNVGFMDIAETPLCLTIPLSAHINIPYINFLYAGIGVNLNIPMIYLSDSLLPEGLREDVFLSMPIDIGFDFFPADSGGMRFFFRITPEFHRSGTVVPIGFVWQAFNIKIR